MSIHAILEDHNPWWTDDPRPWSAAVPDERRDLQPVVFARLQNSKDTRALVVYGPRQVGKTVLLKQVALDLVGAGWPARNVVFFDFSDRRLDPGEVSFDDVVAAVASTADPTFPRCFLFDEVDYAKRWNASLKNLVDTSRDRYVVTSSAASHLRGVSRESGPGRWDEYRMEPLTFVEYARIVDGRSETSPAVFRPQLFEWYLAMGGFPGHVRYIDQPRYETRNRLRDDIADRVILRDLERTGLDVQRVARLFRYLMQNSGLLLDVKKVGEDLDHADRRSVEAWLSALVDTCLIVELPPYAKSARGRLRAHSKWYAVDHGLIQAFAISPDPRNDPELGGMVVEATVFRHLRSLAGAEVFHGRASADREGSGETEKDFVVIREGRRVVVEATLSKAPRTAKLDRLKQTAADLRAEAAVIVYGGIADETYRGVRLLPLHRFLARPEEGLRGAS